MPEGQCFKHPFETAASNCRNCGIEYCDECLVYSFGPKKPPYCIPCALGASGVRANAGRVTGAAKREVRKLEKERRKAAKHDRGKKPEPAEVVAFTAEESAQAGADNPYAWADSPSDRVASA